MIRESLGSTGGRSYSKVPNEGFTMSTVNYKSEEDGHTIR
jgi:hypothetical protein